MPDSADVVIVGGGAMGTSVAYHLAKQGITDVVLLERESLASGSTSKSAGGIRAQFADELNVKIALRSMAELQALERVSGIGYKRDGYLFLLDRDSDVELFQQALALQQTLGVPSQLISPEHAAEMVPGLEISDIVAASYCPLDGHATPEDVVQAYAGAAAAQGVQILQATALERIAVLGDKIVSVETSAGRIRTDTVICTAGVWSRDVGNLAGLDIPVRGEARWMHFTPEDGDLPERFPFTIDFSTGFYFHREGQGLVFGGREPTIEGVASHGTRRLPVLAELPIQSSWWGYYEMSPDHNAIVGEADPAAPLPLRDRLLGARLPAGARGGRAPGRARRRRRAHPRPLAALARPLRQRGRPRRALRGLAVRLFVLARHGESVLNVERRVNGDPTREVPLTDRGQEEARRLGEQVANIHLDACVHTRFPRTRETAEIALGERVDVPLVVEPLLDDIDIGDLEGEPLETYRAWKHGHARDDRVSGRREPRRRSAALRGRLSCAARVDARMRARGLPRDPRPLRAQRRSGLRFAGRPRARDLQRRPLPLRRGHARPRGGGDRAHRR